MCGCRLLAVLYVAEHICPPSTFSAPTLRQSVLKVEDVQTDVLWEKFSNSQTLRHIIIPPVFTFAVKYVSVMFK